MRRVLGSKRFHKLKRRSELTAALASGKGYGTSTTDEEVSAAATLLGKKAKLIVDVGANVGNYAAAARAVFLDAKLHLFEPSAVNLEKLNSRFGGDNTITINSTALNAKTGDVTLFSDHAGSGLASLTKRRLDHFNIEMDITEVVAAIRFEDYWLNNLNQANVDIVKLDIEGHELEAFQGFGQAMQHCNLVQFEFGGCNIDTRTFFQDFWYFFKSADFDIYRITPYGPELIDVYREIDEVFITTNYVAVNRRTYSNGIRRNSDVLV